jgi:NitT/TauT family transport system substrate-binding protein
VQGDLDAIAWIVEHPDTAGAQINARLAADTGKGLSDAVLTRALAQ